MHLVDIVGRGKLNFSAFRSHPATLFLLHFKNVCQNNLQHSIYLEQYYSLLSCV